MRNVLSSAARISTLSLLAALMLALAACGDMDPSHYQATPNPAGGTDVPAGPIWNNADAQTKCPGVCGASGWSGAWHTTVPGAMSVCTCGATTAAAAPSQTIILQGAPSSCTAQGNAACSGCSVSCPPGKQATCTDAEMRGSPDLSPVCWTRASCTCQ